MTPSLEIDPEDPRYVEFGERLKRRIELFHGRHLDDTAVTEIDQAVERVRAAAKIVLPKMTALILRDLGVIEVVRADMETKAIYEIMIYLVLKYRPQQTDLVWAISRSFPHFKIPPLQ